MVVGLLAALAVQAVSGLFGNDEIFNFGPLSGYVSKQDSLALTSLHKKLFYWIVAAIAIHIVAVIAHHVLWREKLVQAMVTGKKTVRSASLAAQDIKSSRSWLAAIIVIAIAGGLAYVVGHAPAPEDESSFQ
jgi:cytochrome b